MLPVDLDFAAATALVADRPIFRSLVLRFDDDCLTFHLDHLPTLGEYVISVDGLAEDLATRARIALAFSGATDAWKGHDEGSGLWYVLASVDDSRHIPGMVP